jgi:hypothetical protein
MTTFLTTLFKAKPVANLHAETMWNVHSPLRLLEPSVLDEIKKSGYWKK